MKKIIAIILAAAMTFSLVACSYNESKETKETKETTVAETETEIYPDCGRVVSVVDAGYEYHYDEEGFFIDFPYIGILSWED